MSLNSLLDWIQAVGPVASVPAIPLGPGVSRDLPWTSMLAVGGAQGFTAPAAWLHGKEWAFLSPQQVGLFNLLHCGPGVQEGFVLI